VGCLWSAAVAASGLWRECSFHLAETIWNVRETVGVGFLRESSVIGSGGVDVEFSSEGIFIACW
jgi:hypothetical protein